MREAGLSRRMVCAGAHTNYDRLSVYIRPSVAAGLLTDDDMASRRAYQHFWLLNLASLTANFLAALMNYTKCDNFLSKHVKHFLLFTYFECFLCYFLCHIFFLHPTVSLTYFFFGFFCLFFFILTMSPTTNV